MEDFNILLSKHQHLIDSCNIASVKCKVIAPRDAIINNPQVRNPGNICTSIREDNLLRLIDKMNHVYYKYGKYSSFEPREIVVSLTLYQRLKNYGLILKD